MRILKKRREKKKREREKRVAMDAAGSRDARKCKKLIRAANQSHVPQTHQGPHLNISQGMVFLSFFLFIVRRIHFSFLWFGIDAICPPGLPLSDIIVARSRAHFTHIYTPQVISSSNIIYSWLIGHVFICYLVFCFPH